MPLVPALLAVGSAGGDSVSGDLVALIAAAPAWDIDGGIVRVDPGIVVSTGTIAGIQEMPE